MRTHQTCWSPIMSLAVALNPIVRRVLHRPLAPRRSCCSHCDTAELQCEEKESKTENDLPCEEKVIKGRFNSRDATGEASCFEA